MSKQQKGLDRFLDRLRSKYRLVILNDETFEERASIKLSRFNVYVMVSTILIVITIFLYTMFAFTPLKEFIPGYGDIDLRRDLLELQVKSDSLAIVVQQQETWLNNVKSILAGEVDSTFYNDTLTAEESLMYDTIKLDKIPIEDALLRKEIEREENYALTFNNKDKDKTTGLSDLNLFSPVKGYVTSKFDPNSEHFGVDVVAPEKESIKATLEGTVILSTWSAETGHVIAIQHGYDLVSFYKHNSVLLKKVGNFVKTGEVIAIIGNSGELSSGPHLHFELWKKGVPVDPETYIVF